MLEAIAVNDNAIMVFYDHDTCQYVCTGLQPNDGDEGMNMSHWSGNSLMFQREIGAYYQGSQMMDDRSYITSPMYHPFSSSRYLSYHSPDEDLQPPYYSSPSTLYNGSSPSSSSDRLSPSIGSRASSLLPCSDPCQVEIAVPGPDFTLYSDGVFEDASCIALHIVQKNADTFNEDQLDEYNDYEALPEPQEVVPVTSDYCGPTSTAYGQHLIPVADQDTHDDYPSEPEPEPVPESEPESDYQPTPAPNVRRRRSPKQSPSTVTKGHNGVSKGRSTQHVTKASRSRQDLTRAFICPLAPYGCTSAFNAKNEWKRHALTQHFRLGFWRCDQCTESPERPNDFNRKDLFVQHVRRMHPTNTAVSTTNNSKKKRRTHGRVAAVEAALNRTAARCYQRTPSAPESCCCVFCEEKFEGDGAMESRTEHVGKHMENRRKDGLDPVAVAEWREDKELEAWLLCNGMVVKKKGVLEVSK